MLLTGIAFLVGAWLLHHWVERRKFYRRDALGNQVYRGYLAKLTADFFESIAGFVSAVAALIGVAIIGLLFFGSN